MFPLFTLSIIVDYSIAEIRSFVIKRKWIHKLKLILT